MNTVKHFCYILYVAAYTSCLWAAMFWKIEFLFVASFLWTLLNLIIVFYHIKDNWDKE